MQSSMDQNQSEDELSSLSYLLMLTGIIPVQGGGFDYGPFLDEAWN